MTSLLQVELRQSLNTKYAAGRTAASKPGTRQMQTEHRFRYRDQKGKTHGWQGNTTDKRQEFERSLPKSRIRGIPTPSVGNPIINRIIPTATFLKRSVILTARSFLKGRSRKRIMPTDGVAIPRIYC